MLFEGSLFTKFIRLLFEGILFTKKKEIGKSNSMQIHLLAGSLSGLISCILLQPLDLVKTRMQQTKSAPVESLVPKRTRPSIIFTARYLIDILRNSLIRYFW
jgi:hypothetical protein